MVESTRVVVTLLVMALASAASDALRPGKPDPKADAITEKRLPLTATPSAYNIELTPDFEKKTFTGIVSITAKVAIDKTKEVRLHAAKTLHITGGTITLPGKADPTLQIAPAADSVDVQIASWTDEVVKDTEITLHINYNGDLTEDMDGFYISTYQVGNDTKFLASTQFESVSARKAFPCLDEPALKATFNLKVTAPDGYGVLFNTKQTDNTGGVYTFETTPEMSTYLVAFVIYDKETFTSTNNSDVNKPVTVWSRKDLENQRQDALIAGIKCLEQFSNLFGIDYFDDKIKKMDQIAIPDFSAGAMENWGLVTYRESALLGDPDKTSTSDRRNIIQTVAHEFAHQWFGDIVSPDYWDVLWLNEGFATYWMYHVGIDLIKDYNMEGSFVAIEMETALEADAYTNTHAMTVPVEPNVAFDGIFDDITYEKAGSVIRMMKYIVGEDTFVKGLTKYLNAGKNDVARPDKLYNSFDVGNVTEFVARMESWSDTAGYPLVTVQIHEENLTATISQSRYLLNAAGKAEEIKWNTPIFTSMNLSSTDVMILDWINADEKLDISNISITQAFILNPQRAGFYRVNYDTINWELIASQLQSNVDSVHPVTRASIVSDVFTLARSGHVNYSTAFDVTSYLNNEVEYVPWEVAFRHFSFLNTRLAGTDTYNNFKKHVAGMMKKTYAAVTFDIGKDDSSEKRIHRENVLSWACKIGHPDCSDKAKEKLYNEATVAPDLRAVVLCEGLRTNNSLWDEKQKEFLASTSATDKLVILNALGCSEDEEKLKTLLKMARDKDQVRPQDNFKAYAAVYNNPKGVDLVLDDISNNTADLVQQFSGLRKILAGLGDKLTTDAQIAKFEKLTDLGNAQSAFDTALAKAKLNKAWLEKNQGAISDWLKKYNSAASASASILLLAVSALFAFLNH